jgi:hypothetical protein
MRARIFHTSINLLIDPICYQRIKAVAREARTSMARIIREGINMRLDQIENRQKEINSNRMEDTTNAY